MCSVRIGFWNVLDDQGTYSCEARPVNLFQLVVLQSEVPATMGFRKQQEITQDSTTGNKWNVHIQFGS